MSGLDLIKTIKTSEVESVTNHQFSVRPLIIFVLLKLYYLALLLALFIYEVIIPSQKIKCL